MSASKSDLQLIYAHSDRIQLMVLVSLFLFSLALANWHDTWNIALLIGIPTAALPIALIVTMPGTLISRVAVSVAYMVFCALHIQQAHGMIEVHFGIFGLLAFLLYYRDWLVIVIAATVIAVHHLTFNFLQAAGYPVYLFDHGPSLNMVFTHAAYVVFQSGFLIYMALESAKEAQRTVELHEISKNFAIDQGVINLTYRHDNLDSGFARDFNAFMTAVNQAVSKSQDVADRFIVAFQDLQVLSKHTREGIELEKTNATHIASAINNMAATLQSVAQNAKEAAEAARKADDLVENGSRVINQTMTALTELAGSVEQASTVMQELESHTNNIGMVLEVIKSIADQTNLLALNAAIEAARAGDLGRGFAVVADEVRTLASRTQKSTQDIQEMIEHLQAGAKNAVKVMHEGSERAKLGVLQSSNTREAFNSIAQSVAVINDMNAQIAHAGAQQNSVVHEIQVNINKIASIAADNTHDASTLDGLTRELGSLADQLKALVGKFKV